MKKYTYLVNFDSQTLERAGESFAVKGDGDIAELEFAIPSNFGIPANQALWRVFYKLPGEKDSLFETLPTVEQTESGDYVTAWVISKAITQKAGRLAFSLAAISGDDIQWNSRTVIMQVPESQYQPESEEAEEPYTGRLTALEGSMASIRGEFAEVQDDFEELKETATLGTPIPKSLASEMVEGGVYLYTGTEPGYTAGHVYYYVGGTLTDGGVYGGTAIDATLTQSGAAADAKVTGDEIAEIKEDLSAKLGLDYNNATRISATEESPADLNDYQTVGNYNIINMSNASHIANIPYASGGYLVVMSQAPNARVQVFIPNVQIAHIYIRSYSSSAWGEWIDIAPAIDPTPTQNSNNLVLSGGVYDAILNATRSEYASERIWEQGTFILAQGDVDALNRIRTNWFSAGAITSATALDGYELYACRMSESGEIRVWNGATWQPSNGAWVTSVNLSNVSAYKTRFLARNANAPTSTIRPSEGVNIVLTGELANINRNSLDILADKTLIPESYGLANVLARFNRMLNIEWTPVADIPAIGSTGVFKAGVTYKGMLYSSTRLIGKVVGLDVSFKTFLTAMKNPRSVLYTKRANYNLGKAYYGSTCASCIDYAMGWGTNYIGEGMRAKPEVSSQNYINLQAGDILYSDSEFHAIMIHDVFKDEYGRPTYVVYDEAFMPKARQIMQKYQDFVNYRTEKGYVVLRNNDIGETEYGVEPYVKGYPDETPESVPNYDIMCNYGDEAVLLEGTDVTINVLNTDGYTSILVYKDDALIQTVTTIADFTLSDLAYGEYRVAIVGDDRESSTSFVIVQASCTWNAETHILTFSSANASPFVVWLNDNGAPAFQMYSVDLTDEDKTNGYIDLSAAFVRHPDAVNVRMDFKYSNGCTASWFSYFNPAWVVDA